MALDLGTLTAYLDLDAKKWDEQLDKSDRKAKGFSTALPGYMGVMAVGIATGVAAATTALYGIGATFDDMRDKARVTTGATGDELDGLIDSAKRVAANVPVDLNTVGSALAEVEQRMGLTGDNLETVTSQILEAGRMLGEEIDVGTAGAAMNAYKVEGADVSAMLDEMFQIAQSTGVGMNDLMARVQEAAPITQQLGFSMSETASMIGAMDKAGLNSQGMIGAMQKGLVKLTKPGEDAGDAFKRVSSDIQGFMDKGDKAAAMELATKVFGTRGAAQFIGSIESGVLNMDNLTASAKLSGDTIMGVAGETSDFGETWQKTVNKALIAFEPIATRVFEYLNQALEGVASWAEGAFAWIGENTELVSTLGMAVLAFAATFVVLTAGVAAYNAIMGIMRAITIAGSVAQWAMNVAMAANPIGLIIIAVAALIAIIVFLVANWDSVVAWIQGAWQAAVEWLAQSFINIGKWWNDLWSGLGAGIAAGWEAVVAWFQGLPAAIGAFFEGIGDWLLQTGTDLLMGLGFGLINGWNAVVAWFQSIPGAVESFFTDVAVWLVLTGLKLLMGLRTGITTAWQNIVAWFQSIPGVIGKFVTGAGLWLLSTGRKLITGLLNGVKGMWGGFMGFLRGIPGKVTGFFSGIGSWLYNAGKDLIDGLLSGIRSVAGNIGSFFLDLLPGWIVGPFKAALGIASPSKVFRGYGRNIVQGILVGTEDMQRGLDERMRGLVTTPPYSASTMALSAAGGASAAVAGVGGVALTIQGNVGWMPDEVTRRITERQRQAHALAGLSNLVPIK